MDIGFTIDTLAYCAKLQASLLAIENDVRIFANFRLGSDMAEMAGPDSFLLSRLTENLMGVETKQAG